MVKYIVFCVMVVAGYVFYSNFPVTHGPGITAEKAPKIERLGWQKPFPFKSATLTPKKKIEATVRVIKKKPYYFDDYSTFSPLDALVGWNKLSDERNLDFIYFTMQDRSFDLDLTRPPLEVATIYQESDLWHLIPSTSSLRDQIKQLRNGHIIRLKGLLVDIETDNEFQFNTAIELSSSREKKGFGVWVEEFSIQ